LPAKEAEIEILDGLHTINVFSQPCEYDVDQNIDDYLRPIDVINLRKSNSKSVSVEKNNNSYFSYKLIVKIIDISESIVVIDNLKLELSTPIPSWAEEGDLIEFETTRIDLW